MREFEGFAIEGIKDFYDHIISLSPVRNYYLHNIVILKTFYGKPKRKIEVEKVDYYDNKIHLETLPYTGAGACGYDSIVEKVYFSLHYLNINWEKSIYKKGLYKRGICSEKNRSGGYNIKWKNNKSIELENET